MSASDTVLEFRPPTEADLDDVLKVLNQAFDGWPGLGPGVAPREHLTWRCHSGKHSMDDHVLAMHSGEVAGTMLRVQRRVKVGDETVAAQSGVGASLVPRLQGQGLFNLLWRHEVDRAAQRGVALHLEFVRHPAVLRMMKGSISPRNRLSVLFRPIHSRRAAANLERFGASWPRAVVAAGIRLATLASRLRYGRSKPPADEGRIESIEEFGERVNDLWESASQDFDFIPVRDREYLNWRYCDQRAGNFIVRVQKDGSQFAGYCVLKFVDGRAYIADLLARSGRLDVVERLVWDADRLAREHDADGIICQLPEGHPYARTLLRAGFFSTRGYADFGVVPLSMDSRKLDFLTERGAKIHITHGDSDLI